MDRTVAVGMAPRAGEPQLDDVLDQCGVELTPVPMRVRRLAVALAATVAAATGVETIGASPAAADPPQAQVVVRGDSADATALTALVERFGGHVDRTLNLIHGVAATVPADAVDAMRAVPGIVEVTPDQALTVDTSTTAVTTTTSTSTGTPFDPTQDANSLYRLETMIGARADWQQGYTGKGVDVALVDSGVAPVAGLLPSNVVIGPDLTEESQNAATAGLDTYGHGTHLAGIIAGHDAGVTDVTAAANDSTDFLGVAPDARIVSVKVADSHGNTDVSQVIAAIDWVVQHAHKDGLNIRVLNLSFGTDSPQAYTIDPLAYAAEQAWRHGIVVVTSAGNSGAVNGRMTDPAIDPFVIAVGADETNGTADIADDVVPGFSSTGDGTRNPDLVAPGVHVQSLRAPNSTIARVYASTGSLGTRFFRGSGTSQAAAFVSGAVALMLQQRPDLTPDQVKYLLVSAARSLPSAAPQAQGAGLLWVPAASGDVPAAPQNFAPATGTGTLEWSRGSTHLSATIFGHTFSLTGERDIFGQPVDTGALAALEANASAWSGGSFNGSAWTGSSWTSSSWASSSWASSSWASSSWASSAWASSSWASSSWASSSWASSSWASSSWASSSWAAACWC